jgi:hypothetical protein
MRTVPVPFVVVAALALLPAAALRAQGVDPRREIQEIARQVDEQLQEIDRLLLESGKKNQSRDKPREGKPQPGEEPSDQPQQDPSQGQPQQQPQQGQRNRRENQTPDIVEREQKPGGQQPQPGQPQPQPQPQPGEGEQQGGMKPQGGDQNPAGGENTRGDNQLEPQVGPGTPGTGDGGWGELQPYMNFLKNRGSRPPEVPERFRKYWEAYLKNKQTQGAGKSGK